MIFQIPRMLRNIAVISDIYSMLICLHELLLVQKVLLADKLQSDAIGSILMLASEFITNELENMLLDFL